MQDFDFSQPPRKPVLLPPNPNHVIIHPPAPDWLAAFL
jgi:hypothetical protein